MKVMDDTAFLVPEAKADRFAAGLSERRRAELTA